MPALLKEIKDFYKHMPKQGFNHAVHISIAHSYIYFENPKAACSTIKASLQKIEAESQGIQPPEKSLIHKRSASPLLMPFKVGVEEFLALLDNDAVFKFCFIRNPYTRLLSAYLSKIARPTQQKRKLAESLGIDPNQKISFKQFIYVIGKQSSFDMDPHWRPQANQLFIDLVNYGLVGRFENFTQDFSRVLSQINPGLNKSNEILASNNLSPDVAAYGRKTSADDRLKEFYDEELQELVFNLYRQDFEAFSYSPDISDDLPKEVSPLAPALIVHKSLNFPSIPPSIQEPNSLKAVDEKLQAPITLIANGRSGTSLLQNIFNAHPEVSVAGETANLIFGTWYAVAKTKGVVPPLIANGKPVEWDERAARSVRSVFGGMYQFETPHWMQKPIGQPVVYKQLRGALELKEWFNLYWYVLEQVFPKGRFFTVLRHPCDVVLSAKDYWKQDQEQTWSNIANMARCILHSASKVTSVVNFDELVEEPEKTLQKLLPSLGVSYDASVLQAFDYVYVQNKDDKRKQSKVLFEDKVSRKFSRQEEWQLIDFSIPEPADLQAIRDLWEHFGYSLKFPND